MTDAERQALSVLLVEVDRLIEENRYDYEQMIAMLPNIRSKQIIGLIHYLMKADM